MTCCCLQHRTRQDPTAYQPIVFYGILFHLAGRPFIRQIITRPADPMRLSLTSQQVHGCWHWTSAGAFLNSHYGNPDVRNLGYSSLHNSMLWHCLHDSSVASRGRKTRSMNVTCLLSWSDILSCVAILHTGLVSGHLKYCLLEYKFLRYKYWFWFLVASDLRSEWSIWNVLCRNLGGSRDLAGKSPRLKRNTSH